MTLSIALVFLILCLALLLFLTGWLRMDIVALLVMCTLAATGLLSPAEALSGFSNPAVITVWSMFILSAGLYQTGVARMISRQLLYLTGKSELKMITVIMLTSGVMSGFINNIGVATLMLPVVMDVARATGKAPSRLLIPLVFGCHLGGFTTLVGTPPNLLVSYSLQEQGLAPLRLFDFAPVGIGVLIAGIAFMVLAGRHLLPHRKTLGNVTDQKRSDIPVSYALQERAFYLHIMPGSHLAGQTLEQSRLRAALGVNVLSVIREGKIVADPDPDTRLEVNDKLFVLGRIEDIKILRQWNVILPVQKHQPGIRRILHKNLGIFEARVPSQSPLLGKNLLAKDFVNRLNINLLSIKTGGKVRRSRLREFRFSESAVLLLQGEPEQLAILEKEGSVTDIRPIEPSRLIEEYALHETLFVMNVEKGAQPFDREAAEQQIGSALGFTIVAVLDGKKPRMAYPDEVFSEGSRLLVKCNAKDLPLMQGLKDIAIPDEESLDPEDLETRDLLLTEAVLAPRSNLEGKTLREVNFRKKYGLTVLAIWRDGKAFRTNLHNIPLRFGEALLLYGKREQIQLLDANADLLLLSEARQAPVRPEKAFVSLLIMLGVLLPVVLGVLPISIASVLGVVAMVLSHCLKMEDAYRSIEWRSVFLIAGMLPLGLALQQTGAADLLSGWAVGFFGKFGPWGVVLGLYVVTVLTALAIPPPAIIVIMSPIALNAAAHFDISPYSVMIALAIAASGTFMTPVSHPANLLVLGPAGYKFSDYTKVGLPLTLIVGLTVFLLLPWFWPI